MKKFLYIIGGILLTLVLLVLGGLWYIHYRLDTEKLTHDVKQMMTEVLGTDVQLKECKLDPWSQELDIYGLNIKDRKKVDMLHVDTLELSVDLLELLHQRVLVYGFNLSGAHGIAYQERPDTATNYQFAVDAITFITEELSFKKASSNKKKTIFVDLQKCSIANMSLKWDVKSTEERNTPTWKELDPNHIYVKDLCLNVKFQSGFSAATSVGELDHFSAKECNSGTAMDINDVEFNGREKTLTLDNAQFKYQDMQLAINDLKSSMKNDSTSLSIHKINLKRNNHKPKKNVGKPNRGDFDPGHLDINLELEATASYLSLDSIALKITHLHGIDKESGFIMSSMTMDVKKSRNHCYLTHFKLVDQHTTLYANRINMVLPSKEHVNSFHYDAKSVRGHVILKDIARPLAKRLKHFTTPLELTTDVSGNQDGMHWSNIHVYTKDHRIDVHATGDIKFGKPSKGTKTTLAFDIQSLVARGGIKAQILGHFKQLSPSVKTMLTEIGDIRYSGKLLIPFKQQVIQGRLTTGIGTFKTNVTHNDLTKRMTGTISSDSIDIQKFLGNPNLGTVAFTADVDLLLKHDKNHPKVKGELPIGTVKGVAIKASYKQFKIKNVDFSITSDGKQASGTLASYNKLIDVWADYSFTGADVKGTLKVKPHIKIHNIIENTFLKNTFIGKLFGKKDKDKDKNKKKDKK